VRSARSANRLPITRNDREHEHRATAPVDELGEELVLLGTEIARLVTAEHDGVVDKKLFGRLGKTVAQLVGRGHALSIVLVRGRTYDARKPQRPIARRRAAQELELPARLAIDI